MVIPGLASCLFKFGLQRLIEIASLINVSNLFLHSFKILKLLTDSFSFLQMLQFIMKSNTSFLPLKCSFTISISGLDVNSI